MTCDVTWLDVWPNDLWLDLNLQGNDLWLDLDLQEMTCDLTWTCNKWLAAISGYRFRSIVYLTMTMMMVYLTHITGSTVLCVCQHHFELLHTSSTVYHLFSVSMFLQMSLTNMHICFIAFSFVSLLLFGSTLSICLIFSLSVVSLKLLTWRVYLSTNRFLTFAISGLLQFSKTCCTFSLVLHVIVSMGKQHCVRTAGLVDRRVWPCTAP